MISVFLLVGCDSSNELQFLGQFLLREDALRFVKMYAKEYGFSEDNFAFYDDCGYGK